MLKNCLEGCCITSREKERKRTNFLDQLEFHHWAGIPCFESQIGSQIESQIGPYKVYGKIFSFPLVRGPSYRIIPNTTHFTYYTGIGHMHLQAADFLLKIK